MYIVLSAFILIVITIVALKIRANRQFHKEVNQLFSHSGNTSEKVFRKEMLVGLPVPVQRYFNHVLKDGQPFISFVRLKHTGLFKTNPEKEWVKIKGEQYFITDKPGFLWKGTTTMFTARDMYIGDAGRLQVSLFSIIPIVENKGQKIDQGELLRWLGESVWFPTNLLPDSRLQWSPINDSMARLTFSYNGQDVYYDVLFNETGEITRLETKRYMGEGNMESWVGKLSNYRLMNGINIPTTIEGSWQLTTGDYDYAIFHIGLIEYDIPGRF